MSRRRKPQDPDGDRSHIPREERSYTEYHPRLLTHLALTVVKEITNQHRRNSQRSSASKTGGGPDLITKTKNATTNGYLKDDRQLDTPASTPAGSVNSFDVNEMQRDDLYAFGQITTAHTLQPTNASTFAESAANLFEINPEFAFEDPDAIVASSNVRTAIDPEFITTNEAFATTTPESSFNENATQEPAILDTNGAATPLVSNTPLSDTNGSRLGNGRSTNRNSLAKQSDRFLRSEVSVEERFERLRREEGFLLGKLHQPDFRKLDKFVYDHKVKLTSNAIAFGYQADRPFELSRHAYIRTVDVPESELADRVEYDMDEQDDFWLAQYNERRAAHNEDAISREIFEITLTKVEKEWTALEKRIPKVDQKEEAPTEDAKCAICDDGECENTNAIVFCDGCNLAVHQECYGVPYIPEGQWLCRKCFASPIDPVSCVFCPIKQGAFKQTSDLHWAHLLCTGWIPEVNVGNLVFMEPIEGVSQIPASRWKLTCYICRLRVGACIQCSNKACYTPFHVSCARKARLFLQRDPANLNAVPKSFCDKHVPDWYRESVDLTTSLREAQAFFTTSSNEDSTHRGQFVVTLKRSKQHAVVPAIVYASILAYMQKFRIRNKTDFIADMCKYWSLKRRSRRGVSLLKRLQLQVEDSSSQRLDSQSKVQTLEFAEALLKELDDHERPILDELMDREILKGERCQLRNAVIEHVYLPLQPILKNAVTSIRGIDSHETLLHAGFKAALPDHPPFAVTWQSIMDKVEDAQYSTVQEFEADLMDLVANILAMPPELASREHRFVRRAHDRVEVVISRCRFQELALCLDTTNRTSTAFDADFEPDGLVLSEEKPFNWANRDASPLSDLDEGSFMQFEDQWLSDVETPVHGVNAQSSSKIIDNNSGSTKRGSHIRKSEGRDPSNDKTVDTSRYCDKCNTRKAGRGRNYKCPVCSTSTPRPFKGMRVQSSCTPIRRSARTPQLPETSKTVASSSEESDSRDASPKAQHSDSIHHAEVDTKNSPSIPRAFRRSAKDRAVASDLSLVKTPKRKQDSDPMPIEERLRSSTKRLRK